MLKKLFIIFLSLFMLVPVARSAEMVNVEYVHNVLNWRWGIDLPYNSTLENPGIAANMKYLLTVVDIANEYLNDEKTTKAMSTYSGATGLSDYDQIPDNWK